MDERKDEIMRRICELRCDLGDKMGVSEIGDWKLSKYQEYVLAGVEPPFDIAEYHKKRQAARDEINALEKELEDSAE
jgi:hypothetical protein